MRTFILLAAAGVATLVGSGALCGQEKKAADPGPKTQQEIAVDKATIGGKTLDQWVADIKNNDPGVRESGIQTVVLFFNGASNDMQKRHVRRRAGKAIINELRDSDPAIRANAAVAIGSMGAEADDAETCLRNITALLRDPQMVVRYRAVMALANFGPYAKGVNGELERAMNDHLASWEVRKAIAYALGTTGMDPVMISAKKTSPKEEKAEGGFKSDQSATEAKEGPNPIAIKALANAIRSDPVAQVRLECVSSLIRLGKPPAAADAQRSMMKRAFNTALQDKDKVVQIWARVGLIGLDKPDPKHLTQIAHYLKNTYPATVRMHAAWALDTIGANAKDHVGDLTDALDDPDASVVVYALQALQQIGPSAKAAIPSLKQLRADKEKQSVKSAVEDALKAIAPDEFKPKKAEAAQQ
jgi:HEAT repeat protein